MKKKTHTTDILYGLLSHHLKSPLASMQSLLFILDRQLTKENLTKYKPHVESLQKKIDMLTARVTQVMEYIRLHGDNPEFLHEFFSVQELLDETYLSLHVEEQKQIRFEKKLQKEMMGDKALLILAMKGVVASLLQAGDEISIDGSVEKGSVRLVFQVSNKRPDKQNQSEQSVETSLLLAIAHMAFVHHGGEINDTSSAKKRIIRVVLPLKPKAKKVKRLG